jgi:hypothetical protein
LGLGALLISNIEQGTPNDEVKKNGRISLCPPNGRWVVGLEIWGLELEIWGLGLLISNTES